MDQYDLLGLVTWLLTGVAAVLALWALRRSAGPVLRTAAAALIAAAALASYNMSLASYAIRSEVYFVSLVWRAAGLVCCVPGCLFLGSTGRSASRTAGLICFLAAASCITVSLLLMDLLTGWTAALITAGILAAAEFLLLRPRDSGRHRQGLVWACLIMLSLMTARALVSLLNGSTAADLILFAGAALFLLSACLKTWRAFRSDRSWLPGAGWLTYCAGTILVALSISPLFDVPLIN